MTYPPPTPGQNDPFVRTIPSTNPFTFVGLPTKRQKKRFHPALILDHLFLPQPVLDWLPCFAGATYLHFASVYTREYYG